MKQGKVWGMTEALLVTPMIEVHKIVIHSDAYCSMHKHEFKWNMFYLLYGELEIHVRKNDYDLTDMTMLQNPGDFTCVAPNEYHRFNTNHLPAAALEIYYLESISKDIIRETVGGITN